MKFDRKEIARKLEQKGATRPCHRCGQSAFTVIEGLSNVMLQQNMSAGLVIGGPTVPVAHVVCNNCGALTPHALGALDLLPQGGSDNG